MLYYNMLYYNRSQPLQTAIVVNPLSRLVFAM